MGHKRQLGIEDAASVAGGYTVILGAMLWPSGHYRRNALSRSLIYGPESQGFEDLETDDATDDVDQKGHTKEEGHDEPVG